MLGTGWTEVVALAAAFVIAVVATPAGISGAVLLLPFQVSVLGTPSPAVTPTNLLYNVVAAPGALYRYWRQGQTGGRLALADSGLDKSDIDGYVSLSYGTDYDRFLEATGVNVRYAFQGWTHGRFVAPMLQNFTVCVPA